MQGVYLPLVPKQWILLGDAIEYYPVAQVGGQAADFSIYTPTEI